jgi:hypothetical protein
MRRLSVLAAFVILLAAAAQADDAPADDAPADETRVIQGMFLGLYATETQAREGSPFSRQGDGGGWGLGSSTVASLSASFRNRGISGQLSASAQQGPAAPLGISFDQAWVKATFGEGWALAFGRRYLKWKDGGNWNPSDVVNYRSAWGAVGQVPGRDSIELLGLLPFMDFNVDISAATVYSQEYSNVGKLPLYLAAGSILYPLELRAKAAIEADRRPLVGGAVKLSLTGAELYGDMIWTSDHPLEGELGFGPSSGSWFRYCVGGDWSADISRSLIAQSLSIRLEYLRQDDGLGRREGSAYFSRLESYDLVTPATLDAQSAAYGADAGAWNGRFFALYRDYLFASLYLGEIANAHVTLGCAGVFNLDDGSVALLPYLDWSPQSLFKIALSMSAYLGGAESEARALPQVLSWTLGLTRSF